MVLVFPTSNFAVSKSKPCKSEIIFICEGKNLSIIMSVLFPFLIIIQYWRIAAKEIPNNFYIIDIVDQAYKNKLISFLEDFTSLSLSLKIIYI